MEIKTRSREETEILGTEIGKNLHGGEIFLLNGDLGAGKTAIIKGIAEGLGVKRHITSPTFVIMKKYKVKKNPNGIKKFIHIDTYRGLDLGQLSELGAFEYVGDREAVIFIEWGTGLGGFFKQKNIPFHRIKFIEEGKNDRIIKIDDSFDFESKFF
jgi:tRNA threonylcarbamoyladenosine biosynthesis protein TsaE